MRYIDAAGRIKHDQEVIDACDKYGVAMVFTSMRHFAIKSRMSESSQNPQQGNAGRLFQGLRLSQARAQGGENEPEGMEKFPQGTFRLRARARSTERD